MSHAYKYRDGKTTLDCQGLLSYFFVEGYLLQKSKNYRKASLCEEKDLYHAG